MGAQLPSTDEIESFNQSIQPVDFYQELKDSGEEVSEPAKDKVNLVIPTAKVQLIANFTSLRNLEFNKDLPGNSIVRFLVKKMGVTSVPNGGGGEMLPDLNFVRDFENSGLIDVNQTVQDMLNDPDFENTRNLLKIYAFTKLPGFKEIDEEYHRLTNDLRKLERGINQEEYNLQHNSTYRTGSKNLEPPYNYYVDKDGNKVTEVTETRQQAFGASGSADYRIFYIPAVPITEHRNTSEETQDGINQQNKPADEI